MARIRTPEAILSYPRLFEPDENGKYSCCLVFPAGTDLRELRQALTEAGKEKFGDKFTAAAIKSGRIKWPLRDDADDVEAKGYPEGSTFVNVRTTRKPQVVSIYPDPKTGKPTPITDPDQVYPGVVVMATIEAYGYDRDGNRGVTFGLGNIQVRRDGERLDGAKAASDEFEADATAVADLGDLTEDAPVAEDDDGLADLIGA